MKGSEDISGTENNINYDLKNGSICYVGENNSRCLFTEYKFQGRKSSEITLENQIEASHEEP